MTEEEDVRQLRSEVDQLRAEVAELRSLVELRRKMGVDAATRQQWLDVAARLWDKMRPYSRVQVGIAIDMMNAGHGGDLLIRLESKLTHQRVPEAYYVAEGFIPAGLEPGRPH